MLSTRTLLCSKFYLSSSVFNEWIMQFHVTSCIQICQNFLCLLLCELKEISHLVTHVIEGLNSGIPTHEDIRVIWLVGTDLALSSYFSLNQLMTVHLHVCVCVCKCMHIALDRRSRWRERARVGENWGSSLPLTHSTAYPPTPTTSQIHSLVSTNGFCVDLLVHKYRCTLFASLVGGGGDCG